MKFNSKINNRSGLLILCVLILLFPLSKVSAETVHFSKEKLALKFDFPSDTDLIELPGPENSATYNDSDFSSVSVSSADLYYTVNPDDDEKISEKYPKEDIWIECGLFEETWNNENYVLNYLQQDINSGTNVYQCTIEKITLSGLPFYKFNFKTDENDNTKPGGSIYLTLYQSHLYIVQFFNFYAYESVERYTTGFETSLTIDGIQDYSFYKFNQNNQANPWLLPSAVAVIVSAAAVFALYKFRKGSRRGN